MSDTKYQFLMLPGVTMFDYRNIEDNLTEMAAEGWRTESIGAFFWKFKRAEPSNKKFSVILASSDSEYEHLSSEKQMTLEDICAEGGWQKEYEWKQMHIFCAEQNAVPLETDEAVRLENIHQTMKKTFIPTWTRVLLLMLFLAFMNGMKYFGYFPYKEDKTVLVFAVMMYGVFIVAFTMLGYMIWLKISRKRISEGGTCASTTLYRRLLTVLLIGFLAICIISFMDTRIQFGKDLILYIIICMLVVMVAVSLIEHFFRFVRNNDFSTGTKKALYGIVTIMLIIGTAVIIRVMEFIMQI